LFESVLKRIINGLFVWVVKVNFFVGCDLCGKFKSESKKGDSKMPLNVRRFCTSVLLVFIFSILGYAQTSGDVMRERVAKAKAFIAVRNYNAAIYELENIRRETSDPTVNGVINVLLMNSYLEQGDYSRAQDFLKELSNSPKINKQGGSANYFAVAGQVVKGARNQLERYRSLGLSVSDRTLPIEASVDVQKMRETLELIVEQSKVLGKDKDKTSDAIALLDEATNVRSTLAKDDYDANRWKTEAADVRESMANSRSIIVNAVNEPPTEASQSEKNTAVLNLPPTNPNMMTEAKTASANPTFKSVPNSSADKSIANSAQPINSKPLGETVAKTEKPTVAETPKEEKKKTDETQKPASEETKNSSLAARERRVENEAVKNTSGQIKTETVANNTEKPEANSPMAVGSLIGYATQKPNPVYPPTAKSMRMTGVVKVEVVIDEQGQVAAVQNTSGPSLLRGAATDAIKKWKFKPFVRAGEPVKATGFVSFNFSL
jgi:TonB family protein